MSKVTLTNHARGETSEHADIADAIDTAAKLKLTHYRVTDESGATLHLFEDGKAVVDGSKPAPRSRQPQKIDD